MPPTITPHADGWDDETPPPVVRIPPLPMRSLTVYRDEEPAPEPVSAPPPEPMPVSPSQADAPLRPEPWYRSSPPIDAASPRPAVPTPDSVTVPAPAPIVAAPAEAVTVPAAPLRPQVLARELTLLTGATGFVGSAVARVLLAEGHTLRLLVRPGSDRRNLQGLAAEIVEGDLTNPASLTAAVEGCRYLLHVAADYRLWVPRPEAMRAANVDGTRALLLAAQAAGVERVVYCSSVAALGLPGDGTPGTEDTPVHADSMIGAYKQSKYDAEQAVRALAKDGLPVVIVNPAAPVGPRDIKPTPTGRMILDAAAGRMPAYVETGLNVVHVDDVARGHLLALERGRVGESYILGGEDLGMAHLLALIDDVMGRFGVQRRKLSTGALRPVAIGAELSARVFGTEPRVTREMLAMADKQMFYSSAKAERELGYTHRPARQAVVDAVAWFRDAGMLRG